MIAWTSDTRVGWRLVAHQLHYFNGRESLCRVWAQPKVAGAPQKEVYEAIPEQHRERVCESCHATFVAGPLPTEPR